MSDRKKYSFNLVAIAGTFDCLHKGHRYFISQAFKLGSKVIIGLTSDKYAKKKCIKQLFDSAPAKHIGGGKLQRGRSNDFLKMEVFTKRREELKKFLKQKELLRRAEIIKISNIYGPAVERDDIEALLVTSETLEGGKKVNKKRKEMGLPPLKIINVTLLLASDKRKIASTRIRLGEIDRLGRVFAKILAFDKPISDKLRLSLKKPLGFLMKGSNAEFKGITSELKRKIYNFQPVVISAVGDQVTKLFNKTGIKANMYIVDFKVQRKKVYSSLKELGFKQNKADYIVKNPPGHITRTLVLAVKKAVRNCIHGNMKQIIKVIGEEDLAGLPAILLSPIGSLVVYGQPKEGIVVVEVSEVIKEKLFDLITNS